MKSKLKPERADGGGAMQADERRFVNFPLCLLSETIREPGAGMNRLASKVIADYAQHCRPDAAAAVVQLAYAVRGKETLPQGLQRVAGRQSFVECVESLDDCWGGSGDEFAETAKDVFGDPAEMFSEDELSDIVNWCSLRRSASFFGRRINNFDGLQATAQAVQKTVDQHESDHGAICMTSIPVDFFNECQNQANNIESMRLFRMVCAVRSLVGKKRFTGTTKDMLRARSIGGKSPAVATAMIGDSEPMRDESQAMESRFRFDRILTEGGIRKFYVSMGAGRRVYLSTIAKDHHDLAGMIGKKPALQAAYRKQAADARSKLTPSLQQTSSFNKSLTIKASKKKAFRIKGHQSLAGSDVSSSSNSIHPETEVTQ